MNKDCKCIKCQQCCFHSCGWFGSIEEIVGAAKIMNMTLEDFAQEYLIREWWAGNNEDIYVPAPRKNFNRPSRQRKIWDDSIKKELGRNIWEEEKAKNGKGFVRASWGHNLMSGYACIFLDKNGLCSIHASKPEECRKSYGCRPSKINRRKSVLKYWKLHQDFIINLIKEKHD
jgi:Fe-S-cluster containining protein